ncbi:DUF3310 domain-containing protein [Staphylococcus coagulans]|uniref:DUF3310 domain-containing protein n=1 Tax=Staphylococcus coagulans TaxID=74706 RepID=UPI001BE879C1|nr:DUF3310 domain-containing protein [Staphylococcus coagulans]MBT2818517.1 DUF3310 domain-containing protein [Staphylococcus coagulans]
MEIEDLKLNDRVQVEVSSQRVRDADDKRWVFEPIFETGKIIDIQEDHALVEFKDRSIGVLNEDTEWYPIPSNTKIETHKEKENVVNNPSHYTYDDIEVFDYIEQVIKDYPPHLAWAIGNAIMCIDRAAHKNDREDIAEARWYLERAYKKWEVFY